MTTKEQERKALAQIRKIVEGLGEDSYVGTAFEGCVEVAEQNIENDWACSYKQQIESLEGRIESQAKDIEHLREQKDYYKKVVEEQKGQAEHNAQLAQENKADCAEWIRKYNKLQKMSEDRLAQIIENQSTIQGMGMEIMKLKAKLYDLIVK